MTRDHEFLTMWSKEEIARVCGEQTSWLENITWPGAFVTVGIISVLALFVWGMVRSL